MHKISVIVPFYSNVDWLCEAIESVFDQSYKNIEVIVVNDGSTEDVTYFLEKYCNLIKYRYQENRGAASARNLALSLATGYYVAFLDSDDIWLPNKLKKQIAFMEKSKVEWSHTGYYSWYPDRNYLRSVNNKDDFGDISKKSYISIRIATPTVIIRSSILKTHSNLRFDEMYRIGQDTKLWQEISLLYPIALIKEPLAKVRMRKNNTYKQTIKIIKFRANEYKLNLKKANIPNVARIQGKIYSVYDVFFNEPSLPAKSFIARCLVVLPYTIGRGYSKYHTFMNRKYKYLIDGAVLDN